MLTFNRLVLAGLFGASLASLGGASAWAFDGTQVAPDRFENVAPLLPGNSVITTGPAVAPNPLFPQRSSALPANRPGRQSAPLYHDIGDAIQQGVRDYKAGEKLKAADALEYAASEGSLAAQWKLGRMYADGDGVDHDDYRAFQYFSKMADSNADISPDSRFAPAVAKAFVALGTYYLAGIADTPIKANPNRAHELFHYAAAYFADPDGQYNLGRLYLDGPLGQKDARRAAQWLNLSAEKGHIYAMATLGNLLIEGGDGVPRQVPKGLMWLDLARSKADAKRDVWVFNVADLAFQRATDEQKAMAQRFLAQQVAGRK
ncbi:MAG: sel1 repeat family protein [Beijerinckiaceae bacterium]|nr:sel1 repeat family protein [Beijerinckiaceae bacterium]